MIRTLPLVLAAALACAQETAPAPAPATALSNTEEASYLIGWRMAEDVVQYGLDAEQVRKAIADRAAKRDPAVDPARAEDVLKQFQSAMQERQQQAGAAREGQNTEWLKANAAKEGVKATASGVQYKVNTAGKGAQIALGKKISVHYRGSLLDGQVFDDSKKRGQPLELVLQEGRLIPGWTEALQLMREGDAWTLWIPSGLAYGPSGRPGIPPNSLLTFELEVLKVENAPAAPAGGPGIKLDP